MKVKYPTSGMNLRDALFLATRLGATVEPRRRTGEYMVRHPAVSKPIVMNARRKDSNRELTGLLRDLWELMFGSGRRVVCI